MEGKKDKRKQEVWATLDRELVRGGMSRSATGEDERKEKKGEREGGRENKPTNLVGRLRGSVCDFPSARHNLQTRIKFNMYVCMYTYLSIYIAMCPLHHNIYQFYVQLLYDLLAPQQPFKTATIYSSIPRIGNTAN